MQTGFDVMDPRADNIRQNTSAGRYNRIVNYIICKTFSRWKPQQMLFVVTNVSIPRYSRNRYNFAISEAFFRL